jgi:hypothetical protein
MERIRAPEDQAMRFPRLTTRLLMVEVLLLAILLTGGMWALETGQRLMEARAIARQQAVYERYWIDRAARDECRVEELIPGRAAVVAYDLRQAAYHAELKRKYLRAAWRPWLAVERDPPPPPGP